MAGKDYGEEYAPERKTSRSSYLDCDIEHSYDRYCDFLDSKKEEVFCECCGCLIDDDTDYIDIMGLIYCDYVCAAEDSTEE